jgi:hypothetical protein
LKTTFETYGTIIFDPPEQTEKQIRQSEWKRIAIIQIDEDRDMAKYYAWFFKKRYNITLMPPLRGTHVTFINDSVRDMGDTKKYEQLKSQWNGKKVPVILDVNPKMNDDGEVWLIVPEEERKDIHALRAMIGLGRPYFGLHMTIGNAVNMRPPIDKESNAQRALEMNLEQVRYIHELYKKGRLLDE